MSGSSARNKRLLYTASSCGIWRSQHGQFIYKAFSHNCRANRGVGVDHQHATNNFCIEPRLAESGPHSMDSSFTRHFRIIVEPTQVCEWIISMQQTTFVYSLVSRNLALTAWTFDHHDGLMKEPSAQLQHTTNDSGVVPRLAESGAHGMESSFSRHFRTIAGPTRLWIGIISTQQTTFV